MPLEIKYFVLKPRGTDVFAEASREAMFTYAEVLRHHGADDLFADSLVEWASDEIPREEKNNAKL